MNDPDVRLGRRLVAASRLATWETRITNAVNAVLARRQDVVMTSVRAQFGAVTAASPPVNPFNDETWLQDLEDEAGPEISAVFAEIATDTIRAFLNDPTTLPKIDVTGRLDRMIGHMAGLGPDTSTAINEQLTVGVGLGESIDKLAARIQSVFTASTNRAERIARTETIGASNGVAQDAATAVHLSGVTLTKSWLATSDNRTRQTHRDADGQTVPIDQPFTVGSCELDYPADEAAFCAEEIVNCRCTTTYDEVVSD